MEEPLFYRLRGRPTLEKVHKCFYDKVYADPLLMHYFSEIHQKTIEEQQTDFMTMLMGGEVVFTGKTPEKCHKHMFITPGLFERRMALLEQSLRECEISDSLACEWMHLAGSCRNQVVKSTLNQCEKRFPTDKIITPNPDIF